MEPLGRVVTYPTNRESWLPTVVVGGMLLFLGVLVVPLVLVCGYVIRVIKQTQRDIAEPPMFADVRVLFVDGLKGGAIVLVYMFVPVTVAAVTVGGAVVSFASGGPVGATVGRLVVGSTLSGALGLLFGYVGAAALVNFAREDRLAAAFDFAVLKQVLGHEDYATAWVVALVGFALVGLLPSIPVLGRVLAPFVGFYALVVAGNLVSDGFAAALDSADAPERVGGEQPTT